MIQDDEPEYLRPPLWPRDQRRNGDNMKCTRDPDGDAGMPGSGTFRRMRNSFHVGGFPQESRSVTVRLNTGALGRESSRSAQK